MTMKYKLLFEDTVEYDGHILYRIEALEDFSNVKKGDLGGYIENYDNLSLDGNCWVYDNSFVLGTSKVRDDVVLKESVVINDSNISGDTEIIGNILIRDCDITGKNVILNRGFLSRFTIDCTIIRENVTIILSGMESSLFIKNAVIKNGVNIISHKDVYIYGVEFTVHLIGKIFIRGDAHITSERDVYLVQLNGDNKHITFFRASEERVSLFIGGIGLFNLIEIENIYENIIKTGSPNMSDINTIDTLLNTACNHMNIAVYQNMNERNGLNFRTIRNYVV